MSRIVAAKIYQLHIGSPVAKAILLALADHASHDGTNAYPTRRLLAIETEYSESAIRGWLTRLEATGIITSKHRIGGRRRGTEWRFDMGLVTELARQHEDARNCGETPTALLDTYPQLPFRVPGAGPVSEVRGPGAGGNGASSNGLGGQELAPNRHRTVKNHIASGNKQALLKSVTKICGLDVLRLTRDETTRLYAAVSQLAEIGATPDEVTVKGAAWSGMFDVPLTPRGLVSNWGTLPRVVACDGVAHPEPWSDLGNGVSRCRYCGKEWNS